MKNELIKLSNTLNSLGHLGHSNTVMSIAVPPLDFAFIKEAEAPNAALISYFNEQQEGNVDRILSHSGQTNLSAQFATGSTEVPQGAKDMLDSLADMVNGVNDDRYPASKYITGLQIIVYTDGSVGSEVNQTLTQQRATALKGYLDTKLESVGDTGRKPQVGAAGEGARAGVSATQRGFNVKVTSLQNKPASSIPEDTVVVAVRDGGDFYYFVRAGDYFVADTMNADRFQRSTSPENTQTLTDSQEPGKKLGEEGNQLVYFAATEVFDPGQDAFEVATYPNGTTRVVGDSSNVNIMSWEGNDTNPVASLSGLAGQVRGAEEAGQVARTEAASWDASYVQQAIERLYEIDRPLDYDPDGDGPQEAGQAFTAGAIRRNMRRLFRRIMRDEDAYAAAVRALASEMTQSPNYNKSGDEEVDLGLVFMAAMRSRSVADSGTRTGRGSRTRQRRSERRLQRGRGRAGSRRGRRRARRRASVENDIETLHKTATKKSTAKSAAQKRRERIRKENMR